MSSEQSEHRFVPPAPADDAAGERSEPVEGPSFPIVGIGASAGGLEAFTELLKHLPLDTGMGIVLVQHLDPLHESALTQILTRATSLPLREVTNNLRVEANHVYVIPPNTNLGIVQGVLKLQPRPRTRTPHRSIDFFFESLAEDQRERAIGVILSGTATDGTLGLEAIKAEGGITFAQDDSARYDSMPRSAVAAGCVDFVLAPEDIAKELARIAKHPYVADPAFHSELEREANQRGGAEAPLASGGHGTPRTGSAQARSEAKAAPDRGGEDGFKKILLLLRNHCGVDFSLYKSPTIQRRIARRMVLNKKTAPDDYAHFLEGNAKELVALYSDVLISVTSFFRNPEAFDVLQRTVFPKLLQRSGDDPLRVWTLGCSTGQEAYSIAMAFVEAAEKAPRMRKLQVFATDLNNALLDKARHGLYAKSLAQDVSPERLRRFFVEEEGGYRITKALREMVVFARQNLITDPPFSRMDLISCRNLLIYLEPSLQKKVFPVFHYALKPGGFLLLGGSESIGTFTDLFEPEDKKHKIYSKKAAPTPAFQLPVRKERPSFPAPLPSNARGRPPGRVREGQREAAEGFRAELNAQREADRVTVNQFSPPGVLINSELQILQFRGATSAYLEPPAGKASFDVLKMAREGLMLPLRAAINKAKKEKKTARKENVRVRQNGNTRTVNVEVIPLKNLRERCFLILFEEAKKGRAVPGEPPSGAVRATAVAPPRPASKKEESRRISELETELAETRDYLQSIQEQHEASNEELQASNEEIQSANEELQSLNEELETSKEELESANEELTTINDEMATRNTELNRLNSDLGNLQTSTRLAIVLLGRDLTIRRFSAQAEKQFNLLASDLGRPISHVRHNLVFEAGQAFQPAGLGDFPAAHSAAALESPSNRQTRMFAPQGSPPDLESLIAEVISSVREREREVQDKAGCWYSLRVRPYLTLDNKVDGAVLVLMDIDALKRSEQAIAAARDYAENTIETVREPLIVLDAELRVESANRSFYRTFRVAPSATLGKSFFDLGNPPWDIPRLRTWMEEILPQNSRMEDFQFEHDFKQLGRRTMLLNARHIADPQRNTRRILLAIEDITDRKQAEESLREADRRKNEFLAMLAHELRNPLAPIRNAVEILRLAEGNEEAIQSASAMMERQIGQMVRLVDDLLDVSRISRGKIELCTGFIDWASSVNHAVEAARSLCESKGLNLTVTLPSQPVYLNADPVRLAQVVGNLLNNACKFSDKGGRIWLTAEVVASGEWRAGSEKSAEHGDGSAKLLGIEGRDARTEALKPPPPSPLAAPHAVIRVRDTGIGIAADQLPRIFDMFTQVDTSLERTRSGLGIGLTLAKNLVELHGGTLEVHSAGLGQGSEFVVRLPILTETPQPPPPEPAVSEPTTALRILVVDDNLDSAKSLTMMLDLTGNETCAAYDGLEAVEAAATFRPDVILLDIGLPELNGYDVARRIREQPWGKKMVLVALTGWGQEEDRRRAHEAGFNHHLTKPVDPSTLKKLLASAAQSAG